MPYLRLEGKMQTIETRNAEWLDLVRRLAELQLDCYSIRLRDEDIDAGIRVASRSLIAEWIRGMDLVDIAGPEIARAAASKIDSERDGAAGCYAGLVQICLRHKCESELQRDVSWAIEREQIAEQSRRGLSFVAAEL